MIKNREILQNFEDKIIKDEKADFQKNMSIIEALYEEAVLLGVFPLKDPLSGIETDIKIAKALNSVSETPKKNGPSLI
ncbi:MAG: hypothetical protein PVF22_01075 [Candidatus Aminicenantes bacterium]|jgi:hypothetical protein